MRAAKVQASLRIRAVSPEPSLLAHKSSESRGTFRQKARSLAPLNGWACAVKICNDGMLEDTNSLDGAQLWLCSSMKYMYQNAPSDGLTGVLWYTAKSQYFPETLRYSGIYSKSIKRKFQKPSVAKMLIERFGDCHNHKHSQPLLPRGREKGQN